MKKITRPRVQKQVKYRFDDDFDVYYNAERDLLQIEDDNGFEVNVSRDDIDDFVLAINEVIKEMKGVEQDG